MVMRELISCHGFRNHEDQPGPSNDSNDPQDEAFNPLTVGPRGTWAASEMEKALRLLHSFLKTCNADEIILEEGATFLEMLEQQRKEFKVGGWVLGELGEDTY